jgi:hypothetical protein
VAIPAVLQAGRLRTPGPMQWLVLAFYLWFCCSYFWTIEPLATLEKLRSYFQEMMIVWLVWEFAESPRDLRSLLRAYVAGSWVLAALTSGQLGSPEAVAAGQIRFAAEGRTPTTWLAFSISAFRWPRLLFEQRAALAKPPAGAGLPAAGPGCRVAHGLARRVSGRRGGAVGCGILMARTHPKECLQESSLCRAIGAALWFTVPHETFERLATIPAQLQGGDLNQRLNIWTVRLACLCSGSTLWHRSRFVCQRRGTEPPRYRSQYGALHPGRRRPVRFFSGRGHCGSGRTVGLAPMGPLRVALAVAMFPIPQIARLFQGGSVNRRIFRAAASVTAAGFWSRSSPPSRSLRLPESMAAPTPWMLSSRPR